MIPIDWLDHTATNALIALLNGLWGGILIALLIWTATKIIETRSPINASTRYGLWVTCFLICAGFLVWQGNKGIAVQAEGEPVSWASNAVAIAPSEDSSKEQADRAVGVREASPATSYTIAGTGTKQRNNSVYTARGVSKTVKSESLDRGAPASSTRPETGASVAETAARSRFVIQAPPGFIRQALLYAWGIITFFFLLRLVCSIALIYRIKRNATPAPPEVYQLTSCWLRYLTKYRSVKIGVSDRISSAVAVGYWHPMILLPEVMLQKLKEDELEQVVLHELAHLKRLDDWTILLQQVGVALLFFHPAIWGLSWLMNRDREIACDDWVLSLTGTPEKYAACLAKIASLRIRKSSNLVVAQATSGKKTLFTRVEQILDRSRSVSTRTSMPVYGCIMAAAVFVLVSMVHITPVIAFPDAPGAEQVASEDDTAVQDETEDDRSGNAYRAATSNPPEEKSPDTISFSRAASSLPGEKSPDAITSSRAARESTREVDRSERARTDEPLSKASMIRWLRAVESISASSEKRSLLVEVAPKIQKDYDVQKKFIDVAESISSMGDKTHALSALVSTQALEKDALIYLLQAASSIHSSSDKSKLLQEVLAKDALRTLDHTEVRDAFTEAMNTIGSSQDYERVAAAFIRATSSTQ